MPTILLKKSDTPGSVPGTANLTNLAGGAEVAVNTADKRMFSMTSASAVIELGTNPSSLTCADASFTVARVGSLTISSLSLTNATVTSATVTTLTGTSANITNISGTSLTVSTATLSGGTANGVLYLNGSKVATSGSALTFDGATLTTPLATVNRASAATILTLGGNPSANWEGDLLFLTSNAVTNWRISSGRVAVGALTFTPSTATGGSTFTTPAMTIDNASNVGIGTTSPGYKLTIDSPVGDYYPIALTSGSIGTAGNFVGMRFGFSGTTYQKAAIIYQSADANGRGTMHFCLDANADSANADVADSKLQLDYSGNLGLGVTPSAWSTLTAFQVKNAAIAGYLNNLYAYANTYFDGTNVRYIASDFATQYRQTGGQHQFYTAPSGTAGNTITFTQAMTLDASGNLGVGATSPAFALGSGLEVARAGIATLRLENSSGSNSIEIAADSTTNGIRFYGLNNAPFVFAPNATERARITSAGELLVGVNTATANGGVIQVSNGITFPATQSAASNANTLDDYEEGTWTADINDQFGNSATISSQTSKYTKIGNRVYITCDFTLSAKGSANSGSLVYIDNLPFNVADSTAIAIGYYADLAMTTAGQVCLFLNGSNIDTGFFSISNSTTTSANLTFGQLTNTSRITFQAQYNV